MQSTAIGMLGLDPLPKPYGTLSGGHRQRRFLALAMVNEPRMVFLDELPQGHDPVARRETWQPIERAHDQGTTVVALSERRRRPAGGWSLC